MERVASRVVFAFVGVLAQLLESLYTVWVQTVYLQSIEEFLALYAVTNRVCCARIHMPCPSG